MKQFTSFIFCYLLFFAFLPLSIYSQEYTIDIQHFGVEDGLLHRDVGTVFEDADGFIWIGSLKGVQRFDGHDFKSWTKANKSGQIHHITAIGQDQDGWLWLWNDYFSTFVFLHPITEEIQTIEERFGDRFPIHRLDNNRGWHPPTRHIPTDSRGRLYFAMSQPNQLLVFDKLAGFSSIPLPTIKSDFIELYFIDKQDKLWISEHKTGSTLYITDSDGNILEHHPYPNSYNVHNFGEKGNSVYYEVSQRNNTGVLHHYTPGKGVRLLSDSLYDPTNRYWQLSLRWEETPNGWNIYDESSLQPQIHINKENSPEAFTDKFTDIIEDSKGRFWFPSAWGLGLAIIKPNRFLNYFSFQSNAPKSFNNSARGLLVEQDTLFANFEFGGLAVVPLTASKGSDIQQVQIPETHYQGRPLSRSEDGSLYIGNGTLLQQYSYINNRVEQVLQDLPDACWSFYQDKEQQLWIGLLNALVYKKPNEQQTRYISLGNLQQDDLGIVMHITPDSDGKLWLCRERGLTLFDPINKNSIAHYGQDQEVVNFLPATSFHYLYIDKQEMYWLATDEGLLQWDRKNNKHRLFSTLDGLSNDVIYAIFEDDYNTLWLSSDYGIMQFDKTTHHVIAYLEADGITHHEFNRTSAFQEEDGTIYFGGLNGITAFHPESFRNIEDSTSYKMLISDFEIYDGSAARLVNKVGKLRTTNTITFHPSDRFFRLKFALPVIHDADRVTYAWKVENVDDDWNYQQENVLQIGKLPYGNHILRVKGQRSNGKWSPHELAITVEVVRPFYLQFWFLLLLVGLLISGTFLYFQIRTRRYRRDRKRLEAEVQKATTQIQQDKQIIAQQAEELRQLDKVKSKFFANVSHELRTPLTLMLGPISSVLKSNELNNRNFTYLKTAQHSGKALLKLIAEILDLSKLESGKIELQEQSTTLFSFVRRIASAFESYAQQRGIHFTFDYRAEQALQLDFDQDKLATILNNLLSNAIKFTSDGGKINVAVEDNANAITITIEDSGRGIHPNDLPHVFDRFYQSKQADTPTEGGTGIGLALSQELAKVMQAELRVESTLGQGSRFQITMPRKEVLGITRTTSIIDELMAPEATPVLDDASKPNELPSGRPHLLIVEDNHSLREYIRSILQEHYVISVAENGKKALAYLQNQIEAPLCQLILSDIMMPEMDGYQLLDTLKSSDRFRHLPVIMLTARADLQDKLKALRIGVDDYLIKPFAEEELLLRIANLLQNQQERDPLPASNNEPGIVISEADTQWLEGYEGYLNQHLADDTLSVSDLAQTFSMSESSLLRQLKRLTGLSPKKYLQEARLMEARRLLENGTYRSVAQVAGKVGYKDAKAFSRSFKARFGKAPSAF